MPKRHFGYLGRCGCTGFCKCIYNGEKTGCIKEINSNNADQILAGKESWAEMTDEQKAKANALIEAGTDGAIATYDDYVLACETFVRRSR